MKVVITGGSKGIGRAIAEAFAREGADVAVCARDAVFLGELKSRLEKINPGGNHIGHVADCSKKIELLEFCRVVRESYQEIDVLVNNVGMYREATLLDEPEGLLEETLALNLYPAYHVSRFFAPGMKARKSGHIFNICSVASIHPVASAGSYTVSKYALLGLSRCLREELSLFQVKVTSVLPGSTLTASWEGSEISHDLFVNPADVAALVVSSFHLSKNSTVDELIITPTSK